MAGSRKNAVREKIKAENQKFKDDYFNSESAKATRLIYNRQRQLKNKSSKAEDAFAKLLLKSNIFFQREDIIFGNLSFYYTDFFIPQLNLNVEIDGIEHKDRKEKDLRKEKLAFKTRKCRTVRYTNEEALSMKSISIKKLCDKVFEKYGQVEITSCKNVGRTNLPVDLYKPLTISMGNYAFTFKNFKDCLFRTDIPPTTLGASLYHRKTVDGVAVIYTDENIYKALEDKENKFFTGVIDEVVGESEITIHIKGTSHYAPLSDMKIQYAIYDGKDLIQQFSGVISGDQYPSVYKAEIISATKALEYLIINGESKSTSVSFFSCLRTFANYISGENVKHKEKSHYSDVIPEFEEAREYFDNITFTWLKKEFLKLNSPTQHTPNK